MYTCQLQSDNSLKTFDIRNFTGKLTPTKEKNRYICPVCGGNNLTIDQKTGKYQCWNGCECREIREVVSPWNELVGDRPTYKVKSTLPQSKLPKTEPVPIPPNATLVRLTNPITDCPQPEKPQFIPKRVKRQVIAASSNLASVVETIYNYSASQRVSRFDWEDISEPKGRDKTFVQCHIAADGSLQWTKGDAPWSAYRLDEALAAAKNTLGTPALLWQEGEKCVEIARLNAIASCTFQGSNWIEAEIKRILTDVKAALTMAVMVFLYDSDPTGLKKAEIFKKCCLEVGLPCVLVNPKQIYDNLPHDAGDIEEILAQMDVPDFIRKLEEEIHAAVDGQSEFEQLVEDANDFFASIPDSFEPNIEITQKVFEILYGDKPWICADDKLYGWENIYYSHSPDVVELKRIANFCDSYPVVKGNRICFPYANPGTAEKILRWVKMRVGVRPELLNPPGINCVNGVLQIIWENKIPRWELIDHTPELYYTYKPIAIYDPNADASHCDRLLSCLDSAQREIFLRVIAASLDLPTVRKYKGRLVKGLLCRGDGNNGKDTLREVVSLMYGKRGITGCTLADFVAYDEGRKFPLAKLRHSRVNWATENTNSARLDKIQSLKAFITGEPLDAERKGVDSEEFTPEAIALFNVNDTPNLQGTLEAIKSRYAVLCFNKTFVTGADPNKGEIEADPRFKYDPIFVQTMVVPAFLNKILQALVDLMRHGIDYEPTESALAAIQTENCHLFQFCQDVGLGYDPNSILTASEIWTVLEQWYRDNGTLDYEETSNGKFKAIWVEQAKPSDKNVKAANQVIPRFLQLFPKAKKLTMPHPSGKKTVLAIQGIGFNSGSSPESAGSLSISPPSTAISIVSTPIPPQSPPQKTTQNQYFHPNHPNFPTTNEEKINNNNNDQLANTNGNVDTKLLLQTVTEVWAEKENQPNNPLPEMSALSATENINMETTPDKLGWVGCDDDNSSIPGVETGVENGVAENLIAVQTPLIENETVSADFSVSSFQEDPAPIINKGTRVRIRPHTLGPIRDGKEGIVIRVKTEHHDGRVLTKFIVWLDDTSLEPRLRQVECYLSWLIVLQ